MPRNDAILWIDLEATGSSDNAKILEFGAVLTDQTKHLNQIGEGLSLVINPGVPVPDSYESPVVVEMHKKSGLTEDLQAGKGIELIDAERAIIKWINDTVGYSSEHIPWAGSGVGHYDSKYIRRDMKHLSKKITYWVYDVGVLRRSLRLIGIELPADTTEVKTHRGLDDILLHVEEMRQYLANISWWHDYYKLTNNLSIAMDNYNTEESK